ncbi:MAG: UDP-N-acetylmuramoyl-tripeptide--D-alanyl-D-alanine ligase [Eubacteriales bacterium]
MIPINTKELASIVDGVPFFTGYPCEITHICIDSRKVQEGSLFIPIKGEHHDGHDFIKSAFDSGAVAVLTEEDIKDYHGKWIIKVDSSLQSIHKLSKYYKNKFNIPFIALTGSSGKTTTKDLIYAVLSQKYHVLRTKGNQNNDLGVPLTLFQLEKKHEIAVIEMGMDHLGEIRLLTELVEPNIAIITNIGYTHIENLKTQDNIFKAKCEIFSNLKEKDLALVNGDDEYLQEVCSSGYKVQKYGMLHNNLDIRATDILSSSSGIEFNVLYQGEEHHYKFNLPGKHNVYNCLCAIALGYYFNLHSEQIQLGLDRYQPSCNRMDIIHAGHTSIINDCYNANPDSMKAALDVLSDYKRKHGRAIAVLGDMLEMGENSFRYHYQVGEYIMRLKDINIIVAIGKDAKYYIQGALSSGFSEKNCHHFESNDTAATFLIDSRKENDCYLIKGSRGMKMEEIVAILERS